MGKIFIGKVVNTHGIKGEFRILSDFELKDKVFKVGSSVIIGNETYKIKTYRVHKGYDMITVEGLNDINLVIPFKGKNVYFLREDLGLESDEYILEDLIGFKVICNDEVLGKVKDYTNGVNPLLEINGDKKFYIPVKGEFIIKVNKDEGSILVNESVKGLII